MKNFILNFKQSVRFLVSIIVSREFAFIYVIAGTIAQVSHTYYLTESISSLSGNWRSFQAVLLSIFISSSLLYFTAIADNEDTKESRKVHFAVTMFTIIEILINIYYYTRHIIIDNPDYQIFDFIFAILISCLIPVTIKLYSSHIRAKEWIIDIENDHQAFVDKKLYDKENQDVVEYKMKTYDEDINYRPDSEIQNVINNIEVDFDDVDDESDLVIKKYEINEPIELEEKIESTDEKQETEDINLIVERVVNEHIDEINRKIEEFKSELKSEDPENNEKINAWFDVKIKSVNEEITKNFEKNASLFLQQFENKVKLIVQQQTKNINQNNAEN